MNWEVLKSCAGVLRIVILIFILITTGVLGVDFKHRIIFFTPTMMVFSLITLVALIVWYLVLLFAVTQYTACLRKCDAALHLVLGIIGIVFVISLFVILYARGVSDGANQSEGSEESQRRKRKERDEEGRPTLKLAASITLAVASVIETVAGCVLCCCSAPKGNDGKDNPAPPPVPSDYPAPSVPSYPPSAAPQQ